MTRPGALRLAMVALSVEAARAVTPEHHRDCIEAREIVRQEFERAARIERDWRAADARSAA